MPSSRTCSSTMPSSEAAESVTSPSPCRSAFSTRLPSACSSRMRSPRSRSSGGASAASGRPASFALHSKRVTIDVEQLGRLELLESQREVTVIGARDQQQGLGELREPVDLLGRSPQGVSQLASLSPCRRASSSSVRSSASGVRSSWPASATKVRSRTSAASRRASISLSVSPSRSTSSRVCGTGRRSPGLSAEIDGGATSHRLDRPQREPGQDVARERRQHQRDRPGDQQLVAQAAQRLGAILARDPDDEHEVCAAPRRRAWRRCATARRGPAPSRGSRRSRPRRARRSSSAVSTDLRPSGAVRVEHAAARRRAAARTSRPSRRSGCDARPRAACRAGRRAPPGRLRAAAAGGRARATGASRGGRRGCAPESDEHDRHRDSERSRHAQADRQSRQAPPSRRSR